MINNKEKYLLDFKNYIESKKSSWFSKYKRQCPIIDAALS
jgi:hypothetical protein